MWVFDWLNTFPPLALYLVIPLAPLAGALVAGFLGWKLREQAHWAPIIGVAIAFYLSLAVLWQTSQNMTFYGDVYTWAVLGHLPVAVGFDIDSLTALMLVIVTFVSLCVHLYTIGYMHDDPGYARFFSYIALFTFSMIMLVMSNNFLQLFFGWEAVGLVSYLLIGFWFQRESANVAALKAFIVNRVGDFGFLIGIAAIYHYCGSLDYRTVFAAVSHLVGQTVEIIPGHPWNILTWIALLLFIGAMGKSAQVPLHVWLPESMEGPTPISALIHAATMVTAGIFMVARMSPIYEQSPTALSVILLIGAITALFMGLVGLVQNDIKRIIAYSTLSQLGTDLADGIELRGDHQGAIKEVTKTDGTNIGPTRKHRRESQGNKRNRDYRGRFMQMDIGVCIHPGRTMKYQKKHSERIQGSHQSTCHQHILRPVGTRQCG